jgi:UDP-2-acetamido-3-amino-2,3-dideoxy-glucuronate N-acetyltransferase
MTIKRYKLHHRMCNIGGTSQVSTTDFFVGDNCNIGEFCIIEDDVKIGDNVDIGHYVLLKKGTRIGDNCKIDSYVRSSGQNKIGNNCTIRYGATIAKDVIIKDNVFISPNVMTIYSDPTGKTLGKTIIQSGVFIGTSAVINSGILIDVDVTIGAMSYVNMNCDIETGIYVGQPAKYIGHN